MVWTQTENLQRQGIHVAKGLGIIFCEQCGDCLLASSFEYHFKQNHSIVVDLEELKEDVISIFEGTRFEGLEKVPDIVSSELEGYYSQKTRLPLLPVIKGCYKCLVSDCSFLTLKDFKELSDHLHTKHNGILG
jgi:hypothetical protein